MEAADRTGAPEGPLGIPGRAATPPRVQPILLAAGASARMGRPKALLDFAGRTALARLIEAYAQASCLPPIVVVGHDREGVAREAERLGARIVPNPDPSRGQASSIREGLGALGEDAAAFAVHPVDAPLVRATTLASLRFALRRTGERVWIVIPRHRGRRGHPGIFRVAIAGEVRALRPGESMRDVIHRDPSRVLEWDVDDPRVLDRIDTPEDHASTLQSWRDET